MPVRHHSPACAMAIRETALQWQPDTLLIEGPSDFNERMHELYLDHRLPIAIYSYAAMPDGSRRCAYYPFCIYSPEWQALCVAREIGAEVKFMDVPWAELCRFGGRQEAADDALSNRYADAQLRRSGYIQALCRRLGVDDFDSAWDELFEIETAEAAAFRNRVLTFCSHSRELDEVSAMDHFREAFMAAFIQQALAQGRRKILVISGGYHTPALQQLCTAPGTLQETLQAYSVKDDKSWEHLERGVALTPYSYERLDRLTGYDAGMPGPGFYHQVWQARHRREPFDAGAMLSAVADHLREQRQTLSTADLIAARMTSAVLANIRGHTDVWRQDIIAGLRSAVIKDDIARGGHHPLLDAIDAVMRGGEVGRLAAGTQLPPLVHAVEQALRSLGLTPARGAMDVELNLHEAKERDKSRLLHCLGLLDIAGFQLLVGTDMLGRDDISEVRELWRLQWSPAYDASIIEAARYGSSLAEATAACLAERCDNINNAADAAGFLVEAALAGLDRDGWRLCALVEQHIHHSGELIGIAECLDHLLYLYAYDKILQWAYARAIGPLLLAGYERALWLMDQAGQPPAGRESHYLNSIHTVMRVFQRCEQPLQLHGGDLVKVLRHMQQDSHQLALIRGAAAGALWQQGRADAARTHQSMNAFARPEQLGDFLTGLFALARDTVYRHLGFIQAVDQLLGHYNDEEFLLALPALRLAFTYFTPREKHYFAATLSGDDRETAADISRVLSVSVEQAAGIMAFENSVLKLADEYGLLKTDDVGAGHG